MARLYVHTSALCLLPSLFPLPFALPFPFTLCPPFALCPLPFALVSCGRECRPSGCLARRVVPLQDSLRSPKSLQGRQGVHQRAQRQTPQGTEARRCDRN